MILSSRCAARLTEISFSMTWLLNLEGKSFRKLGLIGIDMGYITSEVLILFKPNFLESPLSSFHNDFLCHFHGVCNVDFSK